ncbi:nitroreductase family deazaflavin-dependent oxidoreductase [Nocardia otitidiscaviarum]|uniref:nitroreductase/quinone reductase family protein n=1 Tax=Nocardia otitidiscaviarum TaxID=1823 RepID=UPI000693F461|nr:nitroreductase/quinone reductase family protein [Nocardia otitidiscaviarum]MBF6134374.1 nitroreductase family deazaflavin-dependent oxidoreductase [Nocardia otitidiscaviarum]MBF6486000.1 nitroreductase family deazaflavin-dependent oxidoreductase [Nocardia otitidiscaviarum]
MADKQSDVPLRLIGRFNHFASTRLGPVTRFYARLHGRLYTRFGGSRFTTLEGKPVFRLIVPGRKSGAPRPVMLMLIRDGDDLLVCGSNGGNPGEPNWWKNLMAAGTAQVQVGPQTWPVAVRLVEDQAEYDRHWRTLVAGYPNFATYQALSPRRFPIAVLRRTA